MGAIALSGGNYLAVIIGGLIVALLYAAVALGIKMAGVDWLNKLLPPVVVGSIIMVIGIKFMMGSVEEKAQYKEHLKPYIIGVTMVFCISTILRVIASFLN